jgi:hypothetical protein
LFITNWQLTKEMPAVNSATLSVSRKGKALELIWYSPAIITNWLPIKEILKLSMFPGFASSIPRSLTFR